MGYKAKGIITRFCTNYKVAIKTETTHIEKDKTYNLIFLPKNNDKDLEVKAFETNKEFSFDISLTPLLSEIALKGSKVTFEINDNDEITAVEINNE